MRKLTLENFDQYVSSTIYQRGKRYYNAGNVIYVNEVTPDHYESLVLGSGSNYRVEIIFEEDKITHKSCSCPYDWGDICKHQVAVMLDMKKKGIKQEYTTSKTQTLFPDEQSTPKNRALSIEEQLSAYDELEETEQRLVKILAMEWGKMSQTKLMETFNDCSFKHEGKRLYPNVLKPALKKLTEWGIIERTPDTYYRCSDHFADELCDRHFYQDEDYAKIGRLLLRKSYSHYYHYHDQGNVALRNLRLTTYTGDTKTFIKNYNTLINSGYVKHTQESLCNYFLPENFDLEKLERLPEGIRSFLLNERLLLQYFNLKPADGYFYYTSSQLATFAPENRIYPANTLKVIYLMRGEWKELEKLAATVPDLPVIVGTTTAIRQFMTGDTEAALDTFGQVQQFLRKEQGSNRVYLHNKDGIFHILARLKTQQERNWNRADAHLRWIFKNPTVYEPSFKWLKGVRSFLRNDKKEAHSLLESSNVRIPFPVIQFMKPFCQFWVDTNMINTKEVEQLYQKTSKNGYRWMAHELLTLLDVLEPGNEKRKALVESEQQELGTAPLYKVLPRIEEWEIAVKVLSELGATGQQMRNAEYRVAWLVDFKYDRLQAKLQKLSKNGWTKGRAVAFSKLKKEHRAYLTPQDERIINAVGYETSSEAYVYQPAIWKTLVGHPLLFHWKSPGVAVQLIEKSPRLIAREEKGGFRLSLSHGIIATGIQIIKETPTRYILLEVTDKIAQIARAFNGKSLHIPKKGVEPLKKAISGLSHIIQVESAFEEENLPSVEADSRICVHLLPVGDGFHVETYVKPFREIPPYVKPGDGEPTLIALLHGTRTATSRDLKTEKQNLSNLRKAVPVLQENRPKKGIWELEDAEECLELLLQLAPLVEENSIVLEWPKGEKFRISQIASMDEFRMEVKEKNNWFAVSGSIPIDEEKVLTMQELLELSEKQGQFIELSEGKFLALTEEFKQRLAEINGLVNVKKGGEIQLHPLAAPAIQHFTDGLKNLKTDKKFKENQKRLKDAFSKKFRLSKNFKATLRPYQNEGFQWLNRCAAWGVGACLADDMGLGKTIQALAVLTGRAKLGPALVVAPASVCRNWVAEAEKFAPKLNPVLFGAGDRQATIRKAKKGDLIIVTYDLMSREGEEFVKKNFATIILDEAQAIKNHTTKRSEVAMELQGDFKIIMTGTPVENHLGELWNLFRFINPGLLGSLESFTKRFAIPIEKNKDENRREQLRKLLQPFILRRKKDEVLKDLPDKTEITLTAPLSDEERAFYEALRRSAVENLEGDDSHGGQKHLRILAEIMKLRRAACHPKLADENAGFVESAKLSLFSEIIEELLASGHKALVFSQFVGHLAILEEHLKKQNIAYQYLDGSTPLAKRQQRIDAFQAGEGDLFLISLKAGGTGLNLTAADYVIHMDPWWNPAVEDQATDRAHRIGQERPVTVYRLVAEGTIEEKILQLHEKKRDLADSLLSGTDVSAKLTAEDLMNLIKQG